jgi:hypothetical protein
MTDGQNWGWQPEQGHGRQYEQGQPWQGQPWQGQGQPWQAAQDGSGAQQGHGGGPLYPLQPPYPPSNPPTQVLYGPPGGPQGRKPWPARHKVLTVLLGFCGLVFVIGIAAAASSSSSTPAVTSSPIAKAPAVTASPTVTKTATATQTVTTAPPTTPAPPATPAQTAAAVQQTAPSTPAQTTSAAPPASTAPASCYPLSNAGHCYEPGEFCRASDHGVSGVAGDGKAIKCEDNDGWRWEPV